MQNQSDQRLIRVLTALYCETWLLTPQMHRTLTEIVTAHAAGGDREAEQHAKAATFDPKPQKRNFELNGDTAVIPFEGVIGRKYSECLYDSGVTSIDIADRMIKAAASDEEVKSILLTFDSPGGIAMGVPEVGATIRAAKAQKPVIAFADGLCCSAAYWLASQCDAVYSIGSAEVGSIGAYLAILDRSRQAEMQGIHVEMFKTGKYKGMGYPGTSLNDRQREHLQAGVDALGEKFKASVRSGRSGRSISDDVMQGQSFAVEDALTNGLIDGVVNYAEAVRDAATMGKLRGNK